MKHIKNIDHDMIYIIDILLSSGLFDAAHLPASPAQPSASIEPKQISSRFRNPAKVEQMKILSQQ